MKFELMVINHLKKTNNYNAARKVIVAEANEQSLNKTEADKTNSTQKSLSSPKHGCIEELEK
jgi:hypothetical protein